MHTRILLFTLLAAGIIGSANAQVTQEWVVRYNGPGNSTDYISDIAADQNGYVYVTGSSYGNGTATDFATIKYNSDGVQQWEARYDLEDSSDYAYSLAVDSFGNVYVTGHSWGSETYTDYVTIKYNSQGIEQWVVRYNGPDNLLDLASSVAVDQNGNVYVTGYTYSISTQLDYTTIKYDSTGLQQWVTSYNGPNNNDDMAYIIAVDQDGNVYVTGASWGSGTLFDYTTIKYNSDGIEQWVSLYNGPGNLLDEARGIVLDQNGNVYVTGDSWGNGTGYDYSTIKYNSAGVQQWVQRYNGPENGSDGASDLAVDQEGYVYVTGAGYSDYATIKYDSAGIEQWVARYDGPVHSGDGASSLAVDQFGNVYVTGGSDGSGVFPYNYDYATIKYDSAGIQQWAARYNGPGNWNDHAFDLALDQNCNVHVTGVSYGLGTGDDYATIKYAGSTGAVINIMGTRSGEFRLGKNHPNPFNPTTAISYELQAASHTKLTVWDISGKQMGTLVDGWTPAGTHGATFDGSTLPSGLYFYRITAGANTATGKMVLLK